VLGVALVLALAALLLVMSGKATRIAGTDHTNPVGFVANVPSGGVVCQPEMVLPAAAGSVETLIGTYGRPVPALSVTFKDAHQRTIATGALAAGANEGNVRVPLSYPHGPTTNGELCIRLGRATHIVTFAGDIFAAGPISEQVNGKPQAGRIDVVYFSPKPESWWSMLGKLDERLGLGKAKFFGDWTFPVLAALVAFMWVAVARLLVKEMQ
jgi:hypothetical protein